MKLVSAEVMRGLDQRTIQDAGVPGEVLMERAGSGLADVLLEWGRAPRFSDHAFHVFAGKGNNGGDGFVAARLLQERGKCADVWLAGSRDQVRGDAAVHLDRMLQAGVALHELPESSDWQAHPLWAPGLKAVLVDALLGTGTQGAPRGVASAAIRALNALAAHNPVVAVDLPSGVDADTGAVPGDAVRADATVTMGLPKRGLAEPSALDHVGTVTVVPLGIPSGFRADVTAEDELVTRQDVAAMLGRRPRHGHKGEYGRVLVVGGAAGFSGAIIMAARAAIRSGAGLVSVVTPASVAAIVAGAVPEAMVHAGAETTSGSLAPDSLEPWCERLGELDSALIGPGLTTHAGGWQLVERLLERAACPLVLDADALNLCAGRTERLAERARELILTPHPGEMARLLACTTSQVQADRREAVVGAAQAWGSTVVLKGAGTWVATPGERPAINLTGNPGMATGGTGDVLAGLLTGLVAQGLPAGAAARAGVYLHGRAGDLAARGGSERSLAATDLIEEIPACFGELGPR